MKGIVFKELISMMDQEFGDEMTEEILDQINSSTGGAYTSVGYYDHKEILEIVNLLSKKTGVEASNLVKAFGRHLLDTFYKIHPEYFKKPNALEFIKSVDNYIHVEVKKLHPDAELPSLEMTEIKNDVVNLHYKSTKPFADLAEGLLERCIEVFDEKTRLEVVDRTSATDRNFIITTYA